LNYIRGIHRQEMIIGL